MRRSRWIGWGGAAAGEDTKGRRTRQGSSDNSVQFQVQSRQLVPFSSIEALHPGPRTSLTAHANMGTPPRIFAIDWSGDCRHAARRIWLAESVRGELVRLENGRDRDGVAGLLIEEAGRDKRVIVGLDFAFSFPLWFCEKLGARTASDVWRQVMLDGERWLHHCQTPFWGRRGTTCLPEDQRFRKTEQEVARHGPGVRPKSIFQLGGPGSVGTGSLRGMPILATLREAGFSIWPFDPPGLPMVIEIYPRALTGRVNKSSGEERRRYLERTCPALSRQYFTAAGSCEDAFDAAVSALVMQYRIDELENLPPAAHRCERLEGRIWY